MFRRKRLKRNPPSFSLNDLAAQMDGCTDASLSLWVSPSAGFSWAGRAMATHTRLVMT